MKKKFQRLCAEPRTLRPLCQHLEFGKCASCAKGVKLAQQGLELGPDHHGACDHFLALGAIVVEEEEEVETVDVFKKSRKKKKKDQELDPVLTEDLILEDEEEELL